MTVTTRRNASADADTAAPGGVTIHLLKTEDDIEMLLPLGAQIHAELYRGDEPFKPEKARAFGQKVLENPGSHAVLFAMFEGQPVGFLIAQAAEYLFTRERQANCLLFYVRPQNRGGMAAVKLLHGFKRWAVAAKAAEISVHVTSGFRVNETDRLLRRLGFRQTGGNYVASVSVQLPAQD